ncbi:MAG: hypothetical protein ABR532_08435 [Candidatus Dormibacteria bacterium]
MLGTRAALHHARRLRLRVHQRCACCGQEGFFKDLKQGGYSQAKAVAVQIYVAEGTPLDDRETAPAVLEGGVWARYEVWMPKCYARAGEPYGPLVGREPGGRKAA